MTTAPVPARGVERATLGFINMVAYAASGREHSRRFAEATGRALPAADIRLLGYLVGRDPLPTTPVAAALGIGVAQASRQAGQLTELGLLVRQVDPQDRRRSLISLSPAGRDLLDRWVLSWGQDYLHAAEGWDDDDVRELTRWFTVVHRRLDQALPGRPTSAIPARWCDLVAGRSLSLVHLELMRRTITLVAWVGQSGGFDDLLEGHGAPVGQHEWFTLRVVEQHGPLAVAEVAERTGVDHTQASKRLSRLTVLDLVRREVDGSDRRSVLVRATRRGAGLVHRIRQAQLQDFSGLLREGDTGDAVRTAELVSRYVAALLSGAGMVEHDELIDRFA